ELTTGTGTNMPEGVATAAGAGVTAAAQTAITRPELLGLIHSVDPRYRRRGTKGSRLMFNDATLADIKMLSFGSSDDRPLWQPSIREGEPDRIDGYSYSINQDMPDMAAGNRSILFGDFSKYLIRIIGRPVMMRLNERYAEELETAFLMYQRLDGRLLSSNAVKALTQAA
ncbi:MAG: phage major capsid protein, partial [Bacteroidota bacterium]